MIEWDWKPAFNWQMTVFNKNITKTLTILMKFLEIKSIDYNTIILEHRKNIFDDLYWLLNRLQPVKLFLCFSELESFG